MTIIVILSYHNDNSANNFDLWALRDPAAGDAAAAKGYVIDCEGWRRRCWRRSGPSTWRRGGRLSICVPENGSLKGAGAGEGGGQLSICRFPVDIDCEGRRRRRCWRRSGPSTWRRSGGPTRSGPRPTPPAGDARDRMIIFIIIIIIIDYYYHIVFARRPLVMRGPGLYGCY